MLNTSLLLFDLDGVLLDSESDVSWLERSIKKTLTHFHIPLTDENMSHLHFENVEKFREISKNLGIDQEVLWQIRNKYYTDEKLYAMKQRIIQPFQDVPLLYQLKDNFIFGIISNSPQIIVDFFVLEFGFSDLFSINIGRGNTIWDIEHLKPDLFLFTKIKKQIDTIEFLYVGDRESDRVFAKRANMKYCHLNREVKESDSFSNFSDFSFLDASSL